MWPASYLHGALPGGVHRALPPGTSGGRSGPGGKNQTRTSSRPGRDRASPRTGGCLSSPWPSRGVRGKPMWILGDRPGLPGRKFCSNPHSRWGSPEVLAGKACDPLSALPAACFGLGLRVHAAWEPRPREGLPQPRLLSEMGTQPPPPSSASHGEGGRVWMAVGEQRLEAGPACRHTHLVWRRATPMRKGRTGWPAGLTQGCTVAVT